MVGGGEGGGGVVRTITGIIHDTVYSKKRLYFDLAVKNKIIIV